MSNWTSYVLPGRQLAFSGLDLSRRSTKYFSIAMFSCKVTEHKFFFPRVRNKIKKSLRFLKTCISLWRAGPQLLHKSSFSHLSFRLENNFVMLTYNYCVFNYLLFCTWTLLTLCPYFLGHIKIRYYWENVLLLISTFCYVMIICGIVLRCLMYFPCISFCICKHLEVSFLFFFFPVVRF